MTQKHTSVLCVPLYKLYYLDEITDEPLEEVELKHLDQDYNPAEVQAIIDALKWAYNHPDYSYSTLLPDIKFSDEECYRYLVNVLRQIEELDRPSA